MILHFWIISKISKDWNYSFVNVSRSVHDKHYSIQKRNNQENVVVSAIICSTRLQNRRVEWHLRSAVFCAGATTILHIEFGKKALSFLFCYRKLCRPGRRAVSGECARWKTKVLHGSADHEERSAALIAFQSIYILYSE